MEKTKDPTGDAVADNIGQYDYFGEPVGIEHSIDDYGTYGIESNYGIQPVAGHRADNSRHPHRQVGRARFLPGQPQGTLEDLNNRLYGTQDSTYRMY